MTSSRPRELSIAAEDEGGVSASVITNAMLLGVSFKSGADQAVFGGNLITRAPPDDSAIDANGATVDFGRWPDDLWEVQSYTSSETSPQNSAGSRIYALSDGRWKKVLDDGTHFFLDIWEAPRGCWLGLSSNAWLTGSTATELKRVPLKCAPKPAPLSISHKDAFLTAARGLPDGGVAAIERGPERLFNAAASTPPTPSTPPTKLPPTSTRLITWDAKGKERATALPVPAIASQAKLYDIGTRILFVAEGAFVVFSELTNRQSPGPDRVLEPYVARCDAAGCAPLALPETVKEVLAIEAAEDGALLLAGRESAESWSVWSLASQAPKASWKQLGAAPKGFGGAVKVAALYGPTGDDVWAAVEIKAKPVRAALLRAAR